MKDEEASSFIIIEIIHSFEQMKKRKPILFLEFKIKFIKFVKDEEASSFIVIEIIYLNRWRSANWSDQNILKYPILSYKPLPSFLFRN